MIGRRGTPSASRLLMLTPRRRFGLAAGLTIVALLFVGGSALALWQSAVAFAGGRTTAGDLQLHRGEGRWQQITPGVSSPASGPLDSSPDQFVSMPGDVVEIRIPISTHLQGDNLAARLLVDAGREASEQLASGAIDANYRVETAEGVQAGPSIGEAKLGTPIKVQGLRSSSAGVQADWVVVITVRVQGDYRWVGKDPLLDLSSWSVDRVDVTLTQVREGDGYASAGATL